MGAPVVHWEINGRDGRMLQDFYSNLFDWKVDANNPGQYGLVNTGSKQGINGGISTMDPAMPTPPVIFYVGVEDPQAYVDRAVQLGGRLVMPVTEIPNMVTFALFADPEGNTIGVVKDVRPEPPKPRARRKTTARKKARKPKARKTAKKSARKVKKTRRSARKTRRRR